jgi:aromatic ring-cleaving dioxygenase
MRGELGHKAGSKTLSRLHAMTVFWAQLYFDSRDSGEQISLLRLHPGEKIRVRIETKITTRKRR